jgi:hypothetical protein
MGESVVNYLGGIRPPVLVMFNADHGTGLAPCGGITDRRGGDWRHTADLFSDFPLSGSLPEGEGGHDPAAQMWVSGSLTLT